MLHYIFQSGDLSILKLCRGKAEAGSEQKEEKKAEALMSRNHTIQSLTTKEPDWFKERSPRPAARTWKSPNILLVCV
jgi:hypothetical protein